MAGLTAEQERQVQEFTSAAQFQQEKYDLDDDLQRNLIGMLLTDRGFVIQTRGLILPEYFKDEVHSFASRFVYDFFEEYEEIPTYPLLKQEMEKKIVKKPVETQLRWRSELLAIYDYYIPNLQNREYILDEVADFAKAQALTRAMFQSMGIIGKRKTQEKKKWISQVEGYLQDALAVDRNFDIGLEYFQNPEERYQRTKQLMENNDVFPTGLPSIDNNLTFGGICRGEIASVIGLSGTGKSLFLVNTAVHNIKRGKKVIYVTLEIDQDGTAQRFDAHFASAFGHKMRTSALADHCEMVYEALKYTVKDYEDKRRFIIKHFPAGDMSIHDFRAYYTQVKLRGFQPDLVILDYVGEMQDLPDMPTWESRYKLVRNFRGFCAVNKENIGMYTAMQPNKSAEEVIKAGGFIDGSNLGDAYAQQKPLDAFWSINQTADEKAMGVARFFVSKHRNGESRFWFPVKIDKIDLSFTEISESAYDKMKKEYIHNKSDVAAVRTASQLKKQQSVEDQVENIIGAGNQPAAENLASMVMEECGDDTNDTNKGETK